MNDLGDVGISTVPSHFAQQANFLKTIFFPLVSTTLVVNVALVSLFSSISSVLSEIRFSPEPTAVVDVCNRCSSQINVLNFHGWPKSDVVSWLSYCTDPCLQNRRLKQEKDGKVSSVVQKHHVAHAFFSPIFAELDLEYSSKSNENKTRVSCFLCL